MATFDIEGGEVFIGPAGADPTDLSRFVSVGYVGYVGYAPWRTFCWTPGGREFADQWADMPVLSGLPDAARRAIERFEERRRHRAVQGYIAGQMLAAQVVNPRNIIRITGI